MIILWYHARELYATVVGQPLGHRMMFFDYGMGKHLAKKAYRYGSSVKETAPDI
jgi:hypothetical protein